MVASWSAVLAAHNGANFIDEQLRSILDQTVPPVEVLVGDDASRDETVPIVEGIAASHPLGARVRLIRRGSARGVVGNFEDLLARASTDLVALADQDDRWQPTRMELLVGRFAAEPHLLLLHHDAQLVDTKGAPLGGLFASLRIGPDALADERSGRGFERLLRRNLVTGATTVVRTSLLPLVGAVPPGWLHDEWFAIVAAALNGLGVDDRRLIDYRQHEANQIGARRLGVGEAIGRFTQDGIERNDRLLVRAESLALVLAAMPGVSADRLRLANEKLAHERQRTGLPSGRRRRIAPVIREWRTGRYAHFGNGVPDVIRDLVQPRRGNSDRAGG